jgi:hypothetical protein
MSAKKIATVNPHHSIDSELYDQIGLAFERLRALFAAHDALNNDGKSQAIIGIEFEILSNAEDGLKEWWIQKESAKATGVAP